MQTKGIIMLLIFIGLSLIVINSFKINSTQCPPQQIVYKYIPRTFEEEQEEPVYPSDIFKTMFTQQSPWIRSVRGADSVRSEQINKYFVSQA